MDVCHDAGTCDPGTGFCSHPPVVDGSPCSDGDACTLDDSCQVGFCTAGAPLVCGPLDQCHDGGTCDPASGACSNPAKSDGTACADGDACTQTDTCQAGTCTGSNPLVCTAPDTCHDSGSCDPASGLCSSPARPDGTACDDGNACTSTDACVAGTCVGSGNVCTGTTERVSVSTTGVEGNRASAGPSISADGRVVAFDSLATNLAAGDTNGKRDVFVHDRVTGETTLVSLGQGGTAANNESQSPSVSADGRYVAFESLASNLVPGDTNLAWDVFVHDRVTGETTRASVSSAAAEALGTSTSPSISGDGRFVAFYSSAADLVPGDVNGVGDVFVRDRLTGTTSLVSVAFDGTSADDASTMPSISADGRVVAFESWATNLLVPPGDCLAPALGDDCNGMMDVYVRDRLTGTTVRASVDPSGLDPDSESRYPSVSADGTAVAFESWATNLLPELAPGVPADTNWTIDVFVRDLAAGETWRASVGAGGLEGVYPSVDASLSSDGSRVAFVSWSDDLVGGAPDDIADVLVHLRATGHTIRASVSALGVPGNGDSLDAFLCADGSTVAFSSLANALVPNDLNVQQDVFVRLVP
jgi:Tol biopolymer transport system component